MEEILINQEEYQSLKQQTFAAQQDAAVAQQEAAEARRMYQELKQQVDRLILLQAPTPTATPTPERIIITEDSAASPPSKFSGKREEVALFLAQCRMYFSNCPSKFPNDLRKITYAGSFLTGPALSWFLPIYQTHEYSVESPTEAASPPEFTSFKAFAKALEAQFGDPNLKRTMIKELEALKQTSTAAIYAAEFRRISVYTGWPDDVLMNCFEKGLRINVTTQMACDSEKPQTLSEMIALAIKWDNIIVRAMEQRRVAQFNRPQQFQQYPTPTRPGQHQLPAPRSTGTPPATTRWPTTPRPMLPAPTPTSNDGSTPMELDRTQRFPTQPLTQEQRAARTQYRRENNLCLYCGSQNHHLANCPIRPPPTQPWPTQSSNNAVARFTLIPSEPSPDETHDRRDNNLGNDSVQE
jgi:hypothetical protein